MTAGGKYSEGSADNGEGASHNEVVVPLSALNHVFSAGMEQREITVAGQRVRYGVAGRGAPLLLVHGLSGSAAWWRYVLPELSRARRVIGVDLPGFGTMARISRFALEKASDFLAAFVRALNHGPCTLVAHSMGGAIALRAAAAEPHIADRMALVAPALFLEPRSLRYVWPLLAAGRRTRPTFLPILALDALRAGPFTLYRASRELLAGELRSSLDRVTAPVLLLWGEHDRLVPLSAGRRLCTDLPDARLHVIRGAGHIPFVERPEEFNRALMEFLTESR